jgi:SagB-type dehydrogenase family enzyme
MLGITASRRIKMDQTYKDIVRYHEETKHHFHRFAKSSGYMDWQNQPNPFRYYEATNAIDLPLLKKDPLAGALDLYRRSNNSPQAFTLENIAGFLELSLGLSAWKAIGGSRWSLRMNPSSGNLHPTEAHLIVCEMDSVKGGVYHYNPLLHALEARVEVSHEIWQRIIRHFKTDGFLIALTSIFWRESWKYGERAFRYCNHDVGHALAALSFSANLWGWKVTTLNTLSDKDIAKILGFDKTAWKVLEEEHPDLVCFVHRHQQAGISRSLPADIVSALSNLAVEGKPNALSDKCVNWEIIYKTASLTDKPETESETVEFENRSFLEKTASKRMASEIIRQRRSATAFNSKASITKDQFLAIIDKTIPRNNCAPFDVKLMEPSTNLLLFVHNVDSLARGLYFFFRNEKHKNQIQARSRSDFLWTPVTKEFPLYLLKEGDFRYDAMHISCDQEIAGFSAFSLGMIVRFSHTLKKQPYRYRHLFWETGMIGQVLYLEAEAQGLRGTGIGCFFDDGVHDVLGFRDNAWQSLYHFTIGHPAEDPRLSTYPPYQHLKRS